MPHAFQKVRPSLRRELSAGFHVHWENRGVVKRYFGQVSAEELIAPSLRTGSRPTIRPTASVINDFLDATSVTTFTQADIDEIAACDIVALTNPRIKVAVVVVQEDVIELVGRSHPSVGNGLPDPRVPTIAQARACGRTRQGWPVRPNFEGDGTGQEFA